ncbi:MAG TPA: alpha/beta hydrolase [Symbiobacteriaceae bacterium]|nr:alpha/beta hydrolase [Symbiobacteriaceae bacterium]
MRKFLRIVGLVIGVPLLAGLIYQPIATAVDARRYPPPGRMVAVNGHRLHIRCEGSGQPTVVLEAGLGGSSLDWSLVVPGIARQSRVCVYDRAGYGWSEPGPLPRTGTAVADELHTLLIRAEEPGPYIIAAHAVGGIYARVFAGRYPRETAGLVLVDPPSDEAPSAPPRLHAALSHTGLHRVLSAAHLLPPDLGGIEEKLPVEARAPHRAVSSGSRFFTTLQQESEVLGASMEQARQAPLPLNLPLVVVRDESGHHLHLDRPAQVQDAVADVLSQVRRPR